MTEKLLDIFDCNALHAVYCAAK